MPAGMTPITNTMIIMYVNTRDVHGNPIQFLDSQNQVIESVVRANVFLTDTSGDVDNTDEFTSSVKPTTNAQNPSTVTWIGAVSNHIQAPRDYVTITNIEVNDGDNFLRNSRGLPQGGDPTYWQANVAANQPDNAELDYYINFMVYWNNADGSHSSAEVTLDPKLKIDPSTGTPP